MSERRHCYFINERNEEKRTLFKNIFEHTITSSDFDFDETEHYMNILSQLTPLQIGVLIALYNPEKYNNDRGKIIKDPIINGYQANMSNHTGGQILTQLFSKTDAEMRLTVSFLYFNGLVEEGIMNYQINTNLNPIHVLDKQLTVIGRRFVRYMLND